MHFYKKITYPCLISFILLISHYFPLVHRISTGISLLSGILLSKIMVNPYEKITKEFASKLLTYAVIGLGFGTNLQMLLYVGLLGFKYTFLSIFIAVLSGLILGKLLKNITNISVLITIGTAICGGSAIAAISPVIKAKQEEIIIALAVVFLLNTVSLFIFPLIGHYFHLSQFQFGLWSALSIHDTSSVIGATMQYGEEALQVGTTIKLARALWIVPVTIGVSFFYRYTFSQSKHNEKLTFKFPWFILGFILASAMSTWIPGIKNVSIHLHDLGESLLVIALFCMGANFSTQAFKVIGIKPFVQGALLWLVMAVVTFFMIDPFKCEL